jgi:hypothetical protein
VAQFTRSSLLDVDYIDFKMLSLKLFYVTELYGHVLRTKVYYSQDKNSAGIQQ